MAAWDKHTVKVGDLELTLIEAPEGVLPPGVQLMAVTQEFLDAWMEQAQKLTRIRVETTP